MKSVLILVLITFALGTQNYYYPNYETPSLWADAAYTLDSTIKVKLTYDASESLSVD